MNILDTFSSTFFSPGISEALSGAAGKSFLILAVGFLLAWFCRRGAAATRHFIWLGVLASLLALPAATVLAPRWNSPAWAGAVFRHGAARLNGNEIAMTLAAQPVSSNVSKPSTEAPRSVSPTSSAPAVKPFPRRSLILPGWAVGVVLTLLAFAGQRWKLRQIERTSRPVVDPEIIELLDSVLGELGLRRKVRLLETEEPLMPMTWGYWRPAALLPAEAAEWGRERLRLVLRHELAHVRRGDCLTQTLAGVVCALYWFNPLVWLAAARMRVERERACDDLVVALGRTRPSEYAGHLLDIARQFTAAPGAALPVAKHSGLEQRLRALLDEANHHGELTVRAAVVVVCALAACLVALAGCRVAAAETSPETLRQQLLARLKTFSALKEKQSEQLAAAAGEQISPEFKGFFDAAIRGDAQYVTNKYVYYKRNHPQYSHTNEPIVNLRTSYWSPVLEICLAYYDVVADEPEYVREFEEGIIQSIPAGSIYFGGTDPGRGLVTAFCPSQPDANPFFTLTQNALADPSYLEYLQPMYGGKIYVPSRADSDKNYQNFYADIQKRLDAHQLKPGEQVNTEGGRLQVSGQVVVMEINAQIARMIFNRNPDREFYIEESYPLDWMFPHLEPHGLILKINRAALPALSAEIVQRDQDYWQPHVQQMIGDWLRPETALKTVIEFVGKTYERNDLSGFTGNPRFVQDEDSQRMFSKLRTSIAGVYAWRIGALKVVPTPDENLAQSDNERQRMSNAADFAFRQAFALCPYSSETVCRYADFLVAQGRKEDAISVLETGLRQPRASELGVPAGMSKALAALKAP